MKLVDKFKQWLDTDPRLQIREVQLEVIAEEFAMRFGEWMATNVEFLDDTQDGRIYDYKHHICNTKQLLEIYKKENNL